MTSITIDPRMTARRVAVKEEGDRRRAHRLWLVLAAVLVAVALLGATQSPLLDVDEVTVVGARRTSSEVIVTAAGVEEGRALLGLDLTDARAAVAELPFIGEVHSTRSWSGAVTIEVSERIPVAQLIVDSGWQLVDSEGRVLETRDSTSPTLPVLAGVDGAEPGAWISSTVLPGLELAAYMPQLVVDRIAGIRFVPETGVVLDLQDGGTVTLGSADRAEQKILSVVTFLEQVDLGCLEVLDVRVPETPVLTRVDGCS